MPLTHDSPPGDLYLHISNSLAPTRHILFHTNVSGSRREGLVDGRHYISDTHPENSSGAKGGRVYEPRCTGSSQGSSERGAKSISRGDCQGELERV